MLNEQMVAIGFQVFDGLCLTAGPANLNRDRGILVPQAKMQGKFVTRHIAATTIQRANLEHIALNQHHRGTKSVPIVAFPAKLESDPMISGITLVHQDRHWFIAIRDHQILPTISVQVAMGQTAAAMIRRGVRAGE